MLNATFQSPPIRMGCCNTNKNSLIVTTINPIWRSHPVHHGTKIFKFSLALKARKTSSLHTIFFKQNTNQASHCFDFHLCLIFLVKGLDTSNQLQSILTLIV